MFALAFAIGIFSYIIFLLGMIGLLYKPVIIGCSLVFWIGFLIVKQKELTASLSIKELKPVSLFFLLCLLSLLTQAVVNSIGLFGPEIGFDALWYHLTLPKLYLQYHSIFHIPGNILIYSDMPKLTEMLYTAGLAFSDILPKTIHFIFGILSCIVLYKVARKYFPPSIAILAPVIFYSSLVVGWESISAYIDLSWAFFALMTLWAFLEWTQEKKKKWLILTGLLAGLTFDTKLLAGGTVLLYGLFVFFSEAKRVSIGLRIQRVLLYSLFAVVIPLPWFVFSFVHTGNPFFPILSSSYPLGSTWQIYNPVFFFWSFWNTFIFSPDPISPIYLAALPFLIVYRRKLWQENKLLFLLAIGGFVIWYVTPQTGGGRFILPYLPLFTLLVLLLINNISEGWRKIFIVSILFCSIISIGYRAVANEKFIPIITGRESKAQFLSHHLAFDLGDFYDTDGYFASHIKPTDRVLLYGFHNLYYVDFPYIHESWAQKGDVFNYVAVQGKGMPDRFKYWNLVYFNNTTQVRLYSSLPGSLWRY